MQNVFRKSVCSLMAFLVGFTTVGSNYALAQSVASKASTSTSIEDIGKQANALGKSLGGSAKSAAPAFDGTSIHFKAGDKDYAIDKNKLVPSDNGKNIRYAHTEEDFENQKNLFNDSDAMTELGSDQKDALFADAESEKPTVEGEVYSVLMDLAKKEKPDFSDDVILENTTEILGDMENVLKDLVSCDANSALDSQYKYVHLEDLKQCQQVVDRSMTCDIKHEYTAGIVVHRDGPFNMDSCGEGCTTIWLGDPRDQNYHAGKGECRLYEYQIEIGIINPSAIQKVELTDVYWDDQMQVYFGKNGSERKLLQLPYAETFVPAYDERPDERPMFEYPGPYSGASHTSCQQKWSWHWNTSLDVTNLFRSANPKDNYTFRIRTAVQDNGEGYARLNVYYDPSQIISGNSWSPKDCVDSANAVNDGFAKGEFKCIEMPELDANGCTWINGAQICEDALGESAIPGINKLCRKVEVKTNYDFYKGDTGCWKAMSGFDKNGNAVYEEICGGENLGGNLDTCTKYKENPDCKFVESKCTEGMTGASGTCYVNDVTYDCGKDVKVDQVHSDTTYDCKGIACLGESCIDVERTYSTDFSKVNALLNAAQYMAQDMECDGLDENGNPLGDQNVTCRVFGGRPGSCKIAVGGWQDCCEPVGGPGVAEYISMIIAAQRNHAATVAVANIPTVVNGVTINATIATDMAGMYRDTMNEVASVLKSGVDYLSNAFSSVMDNIYGNMDYLTAPFKWFKDWVYDKIMKYIREQMVTILKSVGIDIGGSAGAGATESTMFQNALNSQFGAEVGGYIGSAISFVGWVYLAYQVANLVIQLVYKCEQEEYETVSKNETKNCHYVGSYCSSKKLGICIVKKRVYCCFQSPLSRIMNQQLKLTQPQVLEKYAAGAGSWGSPKSPNCSGIPLGAVNEINWDLINLDEWTALLVSTGNMKTESAKLDMDGLTGKGSELNWTGKMGTLAGVDVPRIETGTEVNKDNTANTAGDKNPAPAAAKMARARGAYRAAPRTDRRNVLTRTEEKLNGVHVDELRYESTKCITLDLGNGVTVRGGCGELSNAVLVCRQNGALVDCENIAYKNALGELLGNKPTSRDYWDEGYRCIKNDSNIDCSTLWSKKAYEDALDEYAKVIGGTTWLGRYVCLDKSGHFDKKICEHAMEQNYCFCEPGEFVCQDGNKPISCAVLGETKTACECAIGACEKDCKFGGYPDKMGDNSTVACTTGNCPYGNVVGGKPNCRSPSVCPYGHK